jgi:endonuclease-3
MGDVAGGSGMPVGEAWARAVDRRLVNAYGDPEWRPHGPPVDQLVATILSQNTSDANSGRAFSALRLRYPTWKQVMEAPVGELAATIRSGGLAQQKAPRIQAALRYILDQRGQFDLTFLRTLPQEEAIGWLTAMDGVGRKTAAIVLLFALGIPSFPVDTHVTRVSSRLGLRPGRPDPAKIQQAWEAIIPEGRYYPLHMNLIRLGRQICRPQRPRCGMCVLRDLCGYGRSAT